MTKKPTRSKRARKKTKLKSPRIQHLYLIALIAVGIVVGLLITILTLQPSDTVTPKGDFASSSAASVRVTEVKTVPARELFSGKVVEGERGVIVSLTVENKTDKTQPYLPVNQLYLRSNSGEIYQLRPVAGVQSPMQGGNLAAGQVIAGDVSFMIDTNAEQLWLYLDTRWDNTLPLVTHIL